jgi:hypothetical protein
MLTVKLVEPNRHEQVYEVSEVWAVPAQNPPGTHGVYATREHGGDPMHFGGSGSVYVMNANGATVAKYTLGSGEPGEEA